MALRLVAIAFVSAVVCVATESLADSSCVTAASEHVWHIESGGLWEVGKAAGNYRVVVTKVGVEHSQDKVQVQLSRITDSAREIIRCIDLDSPGLQGYVTGIRIHSINSSAAAIELAIEMKAMEGVILQSVYLVSVNGTVREIQKATYTDLSGF